MPLRLTCCSCARCVYLSVDGSVGHELVVSLEGSDGLAKDWSGYGQVLPLLSPATPPSLPPPLPLPLPLPLFPSPFPSPFLPPSPSLPDIGALCDRTARRRCTLAASTAGLAPLTASSPPTRFVATNNGFPCPYLVLSVQPTLAWFVAIFPTSLPAGLAPAARAHAL